MTQQSLPESLLRQKLEKANIKYNDYLRSLTGELMRLELITEEQAEIIRVGLFDSLEKLMRIYTSDRSSSLMTETANSILRSLLFNIDCAMMDIPALETVVETILTTPMMELYDRGMMRIRRLKCETAGLLAKAKRTRLHLPNVFYNQTLDVSLMQALKSYDERFHSHLISGDIDYPLAIQSNTLRGIHYLRGYLMDLCAENAFCREYETDEIARLYKIFCDKNHFPYSEPRVNLYTILFNNALFNEYLRKEPGSLVLTVDECDIIEVLLGDMSREERGNLLRLTVSRMIGGNPDYNMRVLTKSLPGIQNAIEHHRLKNYLVAEL